MKYVMRLFAILTFLAAFGCTRKAAHDASVTLGLPSPGQIHAKASAQATTVTIPSTAQLSHIAINVRNSAGGMVPFAWDGNCDNSVCNPPPPEIDMDVPSGDSLIQVLLLYQDAGGTQSYFAYGDLSQSLQPGPNDVTIGTTAYGAASGIQAKIAGQYVTSLGSGYGIGPTERIAVEFLPPTNAPPMVVASGEMFNGWFNVFGMQGAPLQYVDELGQLLPISYNDADTLATAGSQVGHFYVPSDYYYCLGVGNCNEHNNGGELFFGFFGSAAAGLSPAPLVSYSSTMSSGANISGVYVDQGTTSMTWQTGISLTSPPLNQIGVVSGNSVGTSPSASDFLTNLTFDPAGLQNGLNDGLGFVGPFASAPWTFESLVHVPGTADTPSGTYSASCDRSAPAIGCYDGTGHLLLAWNYLPHIFSGPRAITGVTLFVTQLPSCGSNDCTQPFQIPESDGIRCGDLGSMGFINEGDFTDTGTQQMGKEIPFTIAAGNQVYAYVCPYRVGLSGERTYFSDAARIQVP